MHILKPLCTSEYRSEAQLREVATSPLGPAVVRGRIGLGLGLGAGLGAGLGVGLGVAYLVCRRTCGHRHLGSRARTWLGVRAS
eukprot:scaffold37367_cov25-Phaeocystis_antarctica.AAC.1